MATKKDPKKDVKKPAAVAAPGKETNKKDAKPAGKEKSAPTDDAKAEKRAARMAALKERQQNNAQIQNRLISSQLKVVQR